MVQNKYKLGSSTQYLKINLVLINQEDASLSFCGLFKQLKVYVN